MSGVSIQLDTDIPRVLLSDYLDPHNFVGSNVAGCQHDSSVAAPCPSGYNSDSSEARFDDGMQYLGEMMGNQNLSVIELKIYELEEGLLMMGPISSQTPIRTSRGALSPLMLVISISL